MDAVEENPSLRNRIKDDVLNYFENPEIDWLKKEKNLEQQTLF